MSGYQTQLHRVRIAGASDLMIRSLLDRQQYFDPLGEAQRIGISSAAWPIFGMLWPSGAQLAAQIALRPVRAGERILEIGCGLALASLVAHRRGADVTASDCHPLAPEFLRENVRLNGLPALPYRHGQWGSGPVPPDAPVGGNWVAAADRYDLVIGSDVLYERDDEGTLAAFIALHVGPVAEVWIVDPDRGNRPAFNRHMAALGFSVSDTRLDRPAHGDAAAYKGRLLVYRR